MGRLKTISDRNMTDEPDEFGTRQAPLVVRINKILSDYPPGAQILKELIQNADDAKASRVAFLVDPREHGAKDLMKPELARFQGPALVAWNNAKFEKDDWENIGRLDQSSKEAEVLKVGRFGIGFQSVHHITDVPFIVSGKRVGILDPHTVFISNKGEGETGKTIRLSEFSKFADQVAPFIGLFGFDRSTKNYVGTLFRFPYRHNDHTFHSKISDKCYTGKEIIDDLYSSLMEEASHILLFLKCIESIELYTWDPTVNAPKLYLQIELEPACVPRVRELRRMCKNHCEDAVSFTTMGAFSVQVTDSSGQKQSFSWLTCNTVGSSDDQVLSLASKLQVLPWVGIAASLPSTAQCQNCFFEDLVRPGITSEDIAHGLLHRRKCFKSVKDNWKVVDEQDNGFAFCFLPLKDPTGLPVSIHGYFRVAGNRRSIEWPNANNTGESALWNKRLIEALVVPSYAILLASKQFLLSYSGAPALPPAADVPNPYSWLPLPQEVKHSQIWRHLFEAKPSVQSLLTVTPLCWTAADGGKWITPNEAYLVTNTVPEEVAKLLITLNCPVVCLPPAVKECFCYGKTDDPFQCIDQHYVRDQLKKNATASAQLLKDSVLCLKVLEYVISDLPPSGYSCLEGLPIVPLVQPGSEPVRLQRKQAVTSQDLVYMITDDLTRSILPGLDNRCLSHALPLRIRKLFLSLADKDQFCVIKATPRIVCPSLIKESMRSWNPQVGQPILWAPRHDQLQEEMLKLTAFRHTRPVMPEGKWLANVWEWLRSKPGVSLEDVKHLPIVPMVPVSGSVHEQVQLCPLNALGMSLRQPVTAVSQQIANIIKEIGCTLVPHSHIFIGHEDTLNVYLPIVSPLSLLRVMKDVRTTSQLVRNLIAGNKDVLRCYLLGSIAEMESKELAYFRSLPVFKTRASEYVTLQNLDSIVFPPYNIKLPEGIPFPTNTLHISPKEYKEYGILLGREPETLDSFIASHVGPFALCECTDSERNMVFLWTLQQLRVSQDKSMCEYLMKTAFLPSNSDGSLYCPQALYDPEDKFLKQMFSDSEAAFPSSNFCKYLAELKELGLQTKRQLQRNGKAFQSFIIDRARAVIRFDSAKANQCSKHILKALCDADSNLSTLVLDQVRDIPFLFCQSTPPKGYPPQLTWAGAAVESPLPPSSLCASQDQQHLGHLVGSVTPVLSLKYMRVYNESVFEGLFKSVSVDMVSQHLVNVVILDSQTLSDNAASVTEMTDFVYTYLNQQAEHDVNPLYPQCAISVSRKFVKYLEVDRNAVIWAENTGVFLKTDLVALKPPQNVSLAPYRLSADEVPALKRTPRLWEALGIREMFSTDDCIAVLHEMRTPLTKKDISISANILHYLPGNNEVAERVLLPTTKQTLLPPSKCYYNDFPWKQQEQGRHLLDKYDFVDTDSIPPKVALKFGVQPISDKFGTRLEIKYEQKGQQIPVTRRINRLLEEYSEIDDVFKELIQNADDAEASVIKFLIDWRQHKTEYLLKPEMAPWQGPALYVYNDKTFSDQDFDNICELEGATKRRNPTKIGRFGVGFCAVYHLTDVPSFVSRRRLVILDPLTNSASSPGIRFDFVEEQQKLASLYTDQITPYDGVFGCNVLGAQEGFDGTLFRFPFRSEASEISKRVYQRDQISQLKEVLTRHAEKLLIFLQHLKKVEMYEVCEGQEHTKPSLLVSLERDSSRSVNLLEQFKNAVEHGSRMTHYSNTQEFTLTRRVVVPEMLSKSKKKKKGRTAASLRSSSTKWLVASAVGEVGCSSWEHACSVEGREQGDVPVAEVAVPVVAEDGVLPPKLLEFGQVFCFLPLPITLCDQKCLINGYFEVSKNRRDLARLQDEEQKNAWNRLLTRDVLVKAYIAFLKHLTATIPDGKGHQGQFLEWYYKLWPVATASHPLSKELQVAFKKALCESDVPLVWSLADGGKWLPVCKVMCLDDSFHKTLFDTVRKDILDILVQYGHNMAELPYSVRVYLSSGPDSCLATVSFRHYCEEVLLKNLPNLPHDARDTQLLFILKHLGALNDAEGEDWLVKLLKSTACVPCEPNGTLLCPTKLVFPEGLLHELYDVDEERFPSKVFSQVKQPLVELGMVVHKLKEDDVLERAEMIHTLPGDRSRQRCESFMQYLTTVHFVSEVKEAPRKWSKHLQNPLIEALSDIAFLPIQQRPSGTTIPWCGNSTLFARPKEVYSQSGSHLIFSYKLIADLPRGHDVKKLFLFKSPTHDEVLSHFMQIVIWSEADETVMTPQDYVFLDTCMQVVYERLSSSMGFTKGNLFPKVDPKPQGKSLYRTGAAYVGATVSTTATVDSSRQEADLLWNEKVQKELKDRPFIWQESNAGKRFHTPAQAVSDGHLKQNYYPYLVKLSPGNEQYQQFFKALGVESTLTRQKIADVLKSIADDLNESAIGDPELLEFIVHVTQQHFHHHHDNKLSLVFYLPDDKEVMRDAREMVYPESITESDFVPEGLTHGLTHFVSNRIPKAAAKRLGVRDILAKIMRRFEDNEYFKEEDFGQKEEICTRLNNILDQYPADVSIFKEFIQNAEDAMATEITFVIDHRQSFGDRSMFAQHSSWKSLQAMPALLVVNNRKFQEADIQSIKKLGTGGKADASDKIGRFGVGFNVAYHVTDCPTLVSFGEGGLAENFCVFDPQFKYVPSRFDRRLPGARYKMKNTASDGKNSSEHFPDQFAPFLRDVIPQMAKSAPGSFADLETKWPHGYSVFRLPLTRANKRRMGSTNSRTADSKAQELLGYPMTLPHLTSLAKDLTEQAPGMLLFLNHLKRISVFEVSKEGVVVNPWTVEVRHNSDSQKKCSRFAAEVRNACTGSKGEAGYKVCVQEHFHTTYSIQLNSTGRPAVTSVCTPMSKELADQSQSPIASQISESSTVVATANRSASRITVKDQEEQEEELSDDSSKNVSVTQQTDSTWVISKHFGLSDIRQELLYRGSEESLFPLAGVAIPLPDASATCDGSSFTGWLYSHLPLPLSTGIPAHVNGHFWVDPSRKHLEGSSGTGRKGTLLSQWNETIMQEVASRAYVDAVAHCKMFVGNSKISFDWFNSLLLAEPAPSSVLDDFHFSESVYQLMIDQECEVLIADALATEDATDIEWLALTADTESPLKGWFFVGDPEVRRVLLCIGVKLVSTPLSVSTKVSSLFSANSEMLAYSGVISVDLVRKSLKKIANCYEDYKSVIVPDLVPLLTYVLSEIDSPEQCNAVNGLPLMLTTNGQLRLIDSNTLLFSPDFIDLLPEHCMQSFVSPLLMEPAELKGKLLKLELVTPISPKYVAQNIDLPNEPMVAFERCNLELLQRLWEYIAISISSIPEILNCFHSVSIIPTSRSTVVSVSSCKTVLREHGSVTLLSKLQLPVLDFSQVCGRANVTACVKERLAVESKADEVLQVIEDHLIQEPTLSAIADVKCIEVDEFIGFLLKSADLHQYVDTLKKLNIFNMISGEWESLEGQSAVYALPQKQTPEKGLNNISSNSHICIIKINHLHHQFFKTVGVKVLDRCGFYTDTIIPHFALLPVEAQIDHLNHMIRHNDLIALMELQLRGVRFITDDRRTGLQLASEYFDPTVELLKGFLPSDQFPLEVWCEEDNLKLLKQLGLRSSVSDDMWRQFARSVKSSGEKAEHRAQMLLSSLHIRIQDAFSPHSRSSATAPKQLRSAPKQLLQFLHSISSIEFVPYIFSSDVELLLQHLKIDIPLPAKKFICFKNSVFCGAGEAKLVCLSKCPHIDECVLLGSSYQPTGQAILKHVIPALELKLPSLALVCHSLKQLVVSSERCTVTSSDQSQGAIHQLHTLFTSYYEYLSKYRDRQPLKEIAHHLKNEKCLFIPLGMSFRMEKGANLVEARSHRTRPYAMYLHCIPEYIALPKYSNFLSALGVLKKLLASHYVHTLEKLATAGRDPNVLRAISALYHDLVALLEGAEGTDVAQDACAFIEGYRKPVLLPSSDGKLLPANQLVLDDVDWLKERLEQCSGYRFVMPLQPKGSGQVSLPPCLGVQPLSELIFEELDKAAVLDRDNRCEAELKAEAALEGDAVVGCPYSEEFVHLIQSEEFAHGLRRMISHQLGGKLLSMNHEQAIEVVQNLDVKCVYAIRTHLIHQRTTPVPGSNKDDMPCFLEDQKCLYVRFHPKNEYDSSMQLLDMVVISINRILGGSVDAMLLRQVLETCDPTAVERILDQNQVRSYQMHEEADGQLSQYKEGQGTEVKDDLELMLTCNFREGDQVKYCREDSRMVIATVLKVSQEASDIEDFPFPPTLHLKLSPGRDGKSEHKAMSSLLVCKFLSPEQIAHLESLSGAMGSLEQPRSRPGISQEKDVLLELPCSSTEDLHTYFNGISDTLEHFKSPQVFFAIERLLFQLHFDCVHRRRQPETFSGLVEVLKAVFAAHCSEAFIQSLESKFGSFLHPPVQAAPAMQSHAAVYQRQESYRELSSWSVPTVQSASNGTGSYGAGSTYLGQYIPPTPASAPYRSSRQTRVRTSRAHYPILPAPGRLRGGGAYIWGGGMGHSLQQSIWPEVTEEEIPSPALTVSLEDAFVWLKDACRTVQLVKEMKDVKQVMNVPTLEGAVRANVYKYPEALCFYAHEIVLKCLKAVFFAYCGLPNQLVECSNLVQLHQTLMRRLEGNNEVQGVLGGSARSYVHLVSGHGDCCRFPSFDPPAMPCDTHSPAVARDVMKSAMCFVEEIQTLNEIRSFFPEGLQSFTVARPDSWTAQEVEFPLHWDGHREGEEWKIVPVSPHSREFKEKAALFARTMPSATIHRLERIQNKVLWMRYRDCKQRLETDLPSAGEKHLFHGTSQTDPEVIYSGDAGFDVGHSRIGLWGSGNYFAVNASYSHKYAHTKTVIGQSLHKMLVAKVLTGLTYECPPNRELSFPPERADTGEREGSVRRHYNSVHGIDTVGSDWYVYITYSNEQTYPAYIITYT